MSHFQCALMLMFSLCWVSKRFYKAELTCCASLSMISLHHKTSLLLRPPANALFPTPHLTRHQATIPHLISLSFVEIQEGYLHNPWLHSSQRGVKCLARWRRRATLWATVLRPPPIQCHNMSLFTGETKCSLFLFLFPDCSCKICSISS